MHVLIVEDEKKMAGLLRKGLEEENHTVSLGYDGRAGFEMAQCLDCDAIVLDLMLPGIDGYEVARRLRKSGNNTPILVLTARDTVPDVVKGLDTSADDYMTKPFSFEEFLARLRAVCRRASNRRQTLVQVGDLVLDPATHDVMWAGDAISLSRTRFRIVILSPSFFAKNWLQSELDGLFARQMEGPEVILAVWHQITKQPSCCIT
jgi:DNA-binding response OmpR family regulator